MSKVFDLVLGVFREPGLIAELRDKQLPDDLGLVIRLAAGEDAALQDAIATTEESAETLLDASVFFLQQILFAPGADSYRVLGADAESPQGRLRENYRWLMKWLHPDRNQDGWEAVYADRVNVAWQDLKTPDRRAEYDRLRPSATALAPMTAATGAGRRLVPAVHAPSGPLLSGSTVRRLPSLILGSLGVLAAATVAIMYWAQTQTERELSELRQDRDPARVIAARTDDTSLSSTFDEPASKVDVTAAVADLAAIESIPEPLPVAPAAAAPEIASVDSALPPAPAMQTDSAAAEEAADLPPAAASLSLAAVDPAPAPSSPEPPPPVAPSIASTAPVPAAEPQPVPDRPAMSAIAPGVAANAPVADARVATSEPSTAAAPAVAVVTVASASAPAADVSSPPTPPAPPVQPLPPPARRITVAAVASAPPPPPAPPAASRISIAAAASTAPAAKPVPARSLPPKPAAVESRPPAAVAAQPPAAEIAAAAPRKAPTASATPAASTPPPVAPSAPPPAAAAAVELAAAAPTAKSPPAVSAEPAAARVPVPAPAQSDAEALVREFVAAYAAGDLARFDRLLSSEVDDSAALRPMRSRFGSTEMRYLEIQQLRWQAEAEHGRARARFRDTYVPRGSRKAVTESGEIEWIIRVDAGDARIAGVARNQIGT